MKMVEQMKVLFSTATLRSEVFQSNLLIQSQKNFDLLGMRLFLIALSGINPHFSQNDKYFDEQFKSMFIPTAKLTEVLGSSKYLGMVPKACRKLELASVKLRDDNDFDSKLRKLFDKIHYEPREGLFVRFNDSLRPHLLDLLYSKGYTGIRVSYLLKLSSLYAVRLLELLLQYQNIRHFKEMMEIERKLTVEQLRFMLNVPEGAYKGRIDNFKRHVLTIPIKEINERTPYFLRFVPVKEGKKIVAFKFMLATHKVNDKLFGREPKFSNDAIDLLRELGFTDGAARAIFNKCKNVNDCFIRIQHAELLFRRRKKYIKNRLGFLRRAIEEGWKLEINIRSNEIRESERAEKRREAEWARLAAEEKAEAYARQRREERQRLKAQQSEESQEEKLFDNEPEEDLAERYYHGTPEENRLWRMQEAAAAEKAQRAKAEETSPTGEGDNITAEKQDRNDRSEEPQEEKLFDNEPEEDLAERYYHGMPEENRLRRMQEAAAEKAQRAKEEETSPTGEGDNITAEKQDRNDRSEESQEEKLFDNEPEEDLAERYYHGTPEENRLWRMQEAAAEKAQRAKAEENSPTGEDADVAAEKQDRYNRLEERLTDKASDDSSDKKSDGMMLLSDIIFPMLPEKVREKLLERRAQREAAAKAAAAAADSNNSSPNTNEQAHSPTTEASRTTQGRDDTAEQDMPTITISDPRQLNAISNPLGRALLQGIYDTVMTTPYPNQERRDTETGSAQSRDNTAADKQNSRNKATDKTQKREPTSQEIVDQAFKNGTVLQLIRQTQKNIKIQEEIIAKSYAEEGEQTPENNPNVKNPRYVYLNGHKVPGKALENVLSYIHEKRLKGSVDDFLNAYGVTLNEAIRVYRKVYGELPKAAELPPGYFDRKDEKNNQNNSGEQSDS